MAIEPHSKGFLEFIYSFYQSMKLNEITMAYEGEITHQVIKTFTSLARSGMFKENIPSPTIRTVFHVMVELMQNASRYADRLNDEGPTRQGKGIFMLSRDHDGYYVICGNIVNKDKTHALERQIDYVNSLDIQNLKELFKQRIMEGSISERGGAGLGLIDVRRKTDRALEYHFLPVSDDKSFFLITAFVEYKDKSKS